MPSSAESSNDLPIRLIVIFGGESAEHDVSCSTAVHVLAATDKDRYDIQTIGIDRTGGWVVAEEAMAILADGARPLPERLTAEGPATSLVPAVSSAQPGQQIVVLPLLHGPLGEDGTIQGMLELANVPYVGAGVLGSALTMDKAKAKEVLRATGVPQTRWMTLYEPDFDGDLSPLVEELGLPMFVKPANMGSSVGVTKAHDRAELAAALELSFRYDEWVVVEEAVTAREIEFALLGNTVVECSVGGEIIPGAEFYSYDDKYADGIATDVIPADIPADDMLAMQQLAEIAYRALRVEGLARADFLYEDGGRGPLLNELNTMPGFTPISMYPKLWAASGLAYPDLIDRLVELALERHARRSAKRVTTH
ncbi:MAG: D-alanine--D-alanine ligase family protein [Acidimicrobiales bacterium]